MMERTTTFSKSSSPGEFAALIAMTASCWEDILRQKSLQFIGPLTPTTRTFGSTANGPANPTTASQFIALQGTANVAEDTSISWFTISSLRGEGTETHTYTKNGLSELFSGMVVQALFEMIGKPSITKWTTPVEDENLSSEDREAYAKTLQLAARIEHLYRTDEGFRSWYHEGIDEIEAGHFVTFTEDGWKEE